MTDLLAALNVRRSLAQRPAVGDLPPAIKPTGVTLSASLLAAQVLPQLAPFGLVRIDVLGQRLVAHRQLAGDLFRAPLQLQQRAGLLLHPRRHQGRVAAALCTLLRELARLLGPVATAACVAAQLTADRGFAAAQQIGNLCDVVRGIHKAVNLISFDLAEVFVVQLATSTCRSRSLEC